MAKNICHHCDKKIEYKQESVKVEQKIFKTFGKIYEETKKVVTCPHCSQKLLLSYERHLISK